MTEGADDWQGKILLVYLKSGGPSVQAGVALADPRLETRHGVEFLVGRVPAQEKDWASGLSVGVRWSEVLHYLVFDSAAEYVSKVREAPAFWEIK